tara:strand:- start:6294 stop:8189 length:1896 start_codon:yes stop_codon:yes gene_type:complete
VATPGDILTATEALERMQQMGGDSEASSAALEKVGQNITNSSIFGVGKPKTKGTLESAEKTRLKNKMDIVVESWFRLKKRYEKGDEKGATAVAKTKDDVKATKELADSGKKQGKGLLGWLSGLLGALGLFGTGGGRGILTVIGQWLWKAIKWVGTKIWGFIKWAIGKAWKILKGIFRGMWRAIKGIGRGVWGAIKGAIRGIGKLFSGLWKGFKKLPIWKALGSAISSGVNAAKGIFTAAKDKFVGALKSVGNFFKGALSKIPGIGKLFPGLAKGPKPPSGARPSGGGAKKPSLLGKLWGGVKDIGGKVVGGAKALGGKVMAGGKAVYEAGKSGVKWVGDKVSKFAIKPAKAMVGSMLGKTIGAGGKGVVRFLGGVGKRLPIIGPAIEALFTASDIKKYKKQYAEGKIDRDQLEDLVGVRAIKGITALIGAGAGAFLGGLVSLGTGPFAPLVAWLPMLVGALAGDLLGRFVGGLLAKHVLPKSAVKGIGKFFAGNDPSPGSAAGLEASPMKLNDFLRHRGRLYPINSKDTLIGGKPGGAIREFFGSRNDAYHAKLASLQISAIQLSNKYLQRLVQLTEVLVKKPVGGGSQTLNPPLPQSNELQGDLSGPQYTDGRAEFYNSPYSMHTPGIPT